MALPCRVLSLANMAESHHGRHNVQSRCRRRSATLRAHQWGARSLQKASEAMAACVLFHSCCRRSRATPHLDRHPRLRLAVIPGLVYRPVLGQNDQTDLLDRSAPRLLQQCSKRTDRLALRVSYQSYHYRQTEHLLHQEIERTYLNTLISSRHRQMLLDSHNYPCRYPSSARDTINCPLPLTSKSL